MNLIVEIYITLALLTLISYTIQERDSGYTRNYVIIYMALILASSAAAVLIMEFPNVDSNLVVFHIYTPLEYAILCLLYHRSIQNTKAKKIIIVSVPIFVIFCAVSTLSIQRINQSNSLTGVLSSILIVSYSLYFLRETIILQQESALQRFPMFWISLGILFYFIGNLFVEGLLNHLMERSMDAARQIYRMGFIFKYLLFILFIAGAYCRTLFKAQSS